MTMTTSISPHIKSGRSTQSIMGKVIIAMVPALIYSVVQFGLRALLLTCVSAAACVLCEYLWEKLRHQDITVGDLSAVVTGILIAFNVPAGMPVWELLVGDVCAIIGVKMLFGGIGCNFMNPALVGRIVMMFSFTTDMTTYPVPNFCHLGQAVDAVSCATPLTFMDRLEGANWIDLLLGFHGGVLGEVCALALIAGGIFLVVTKVIKPIIPLCYMGSLVVFTWVFGGAGPLMSVLAGGVMLGAIFMATDYTTSPITNKGKVIFGIGCGFVNAAIRVFGNYAEGVTFAILLMNILVPYINDLTMTKPLGGASEK